MAVRIMTYQGLLYQDLIRQDAFTPSGKLPPILPIVLYNGEKRWTAAQNVAELVERVPGGLERYRPDMAYLLLDEGYNGQKLNRLFAGILRLAPCKELTVCISEVGIRWLISRYMRKAG